MKHSKHLMIFLALALLMLAALGCSNFGYENGKVSVDVTLSADAMNGVISSLKLDEGSFVGKIEKIEFVEPNIMRITGEFRLKGGQKSAGAVDFAFTTTDNGLSVKIVDSSVPGLDENSSVVQSFNKALENALGKVASDKSNGKGGVTDIKVKNDELVITLSLKVK